MAQLPESRPFKFLFVPADNAAPIEERFFEGAGEEALKKLMMSHFAGSSLSNGQRTDMAAHLREKAKETAEKNKVAPNVGEENAETYPPQKDSQQMATLLAAAMEKSSYEIVPVVMPMRANKFIGTSLYIDDAGRFKDLPLNGRASTVAQKDIRGDAFMLSNHDDPALETWERVDCTKEVFDRVAKNPTATLDTADRAAMARATMLRENDAKTISEEEAVKGLQAKADGNAFFAKGDLKAAVQAYSACIEATAGRADLCPNGDEITAARTASFLNRSLCHGKLGDWNAAEKDASKVVYGIDDHNVKGWYRLAFARSYLKDFEGAEEALTFCVSVDENQTAAADVAQLRADMASAKVRLEATEKKKYSKMFA